jgi:hypothetical protein
MTQDTHKTTVVFRVFKQGGDVLALFPHEVWSADGACASYQHVGQHGGADYTHCIDITRPAKPSEYKALKAELMRIGYNLDVRTRRGRRA